MDLLRMLSVLKSTGIRSQALGTIADRLRVVALRNPREVDPNVWDKIYDSGLLDEQTRTALESTYGTCSSKSCCYPTFFDVRGSKTGNLYCHEVCAMIEDDMHYPCISCGTEVLPSDFLLDDSGFQGWAAGHDESVYFCSTKCFYDQRIREIKGRIAPENVLQYLEMRTNFTIENLSNNRDELGRETIQALAWEVEDPDRYLEFVIDWTRS